MSGNWAQTCKTCGKRYTWKSELPVDPGCPHCSKSSVITISTTDDSSAEAEAAIEQCDEIIDLCGDMPARGEDFGMSVIGRVEDIRETITNTSRVTPGQQQALNNMQSGVERWLR